VSCDHPGVPLDDRNLVWRAAACLAAVTGRTPDRAGVRVAIRKRIPLQAGLGGGSADAAATLVTLVRLWKARLPAGRLRGLAAGVGADVPFLLSGGTALGCGRGDEIRPLAELPTRWVVLACPDFGVPTADAYRWFDEDEGRPNGGDRVPFVLRPFDGAPASWPYRGLAADGALRVAPSTVEGREPQEERSPRRGARRAGLDVINDLEPCVTRRHPVIADTVEGFWEAGAEAAGMSGSGSAVFGLFESAGPARRAAERLARPAWTVLVTRTLTRAEVAARLRPRARA